MPDEVKPNPASAPTHDAQLAAENMVSGQEKTPSVDMEADYQAAQKLSVSDVDRTQEGAKLATEATAPGQEMPQTQETKTTAQSTSDPNNYMKMAKDVGGSRDEAVTEVSDDVLDEALRKSQPKK